MKKNKYAIEIIYSEEDEGHIAIAPELPDCSAFGETEEEALKEIKIAIDLWLETAKRGERNSKTNRKGAFEDCGRGLDKLSHNTPRSKCVEFIF